jgi:hypothetical protein
LGSLILIAWSATLLAGIFSSQIKLLFRVLQLPLSFAHVNQRRHSGVTVRVAPRF